jgi:hypothetical protein
VLAQYNGTVAATQTHLDSTKDFMSQLLNFQQVEVDGNIAWTDDQLGGLLAKQHKTLDMKLGLAGATTSSQPPFLALAGDAADGVYAVTNLIAENDSQGLIAYKEQYSDAYGEPPELYSSRYQDAINLLAWAIGEAATVTGPDIRKALTRASDRPAVMTRYTWSTSGDIGVFRLDYLHQGPTPYRCQRGHGVSGALVSPVLVQLVLMLGALVAVGTFQCTASAAAVESCGDASRHGGLRCGHGGFVYRPGRHAAQFPAIVARFGLSMLIRNAVVLIGGPEPLSFQGPFGTETVLGARIYAQYLLILGTLLLLMAAQEGVFRFSIGRPLRATAQDAETARLMGICTNRIVAIIFAYTAMLAGLAALPAVLRIGGYGRQGLT